ncbi:MAG TPA: class IV adenylate cyclase [Candidatus Binataceae bacterium]|nr:class IV adenylate cyclase [Candidatus Binataceae bacterium]
MRNLEAKFRLRDLNQARERAMAIGYSSRSVLRQRDTFFRVANGKLKLREGGEESRAILIHYGRRETDTLQLSNYEIVPIPDAEKTRAMLSDALGVIAEVRKERILLMRANVRLHLDRVEGLGDFGEIEAVIADGDDPEASRAAVKETLAALQIGRDDLIDISYFEIAAQAAQPK